PTVVDFAMSNPGLSSLVAALQSADSQNPSPSLIPTLTGNGPFTVFAPTNDAFASLLKELDPSGNTKLGDLDKATVEMVLKYHVVNGNITSDKIPSGVVGTLGGDVTINAAALTITDPNGRVSNIIPTLVDIQASNGVVHAIDKVVLPQMGQ
ncbi:fasciclin domain-containing protein, partial [Gelidibacter sp.]|uniref:fasciclin domain-containing protein n=1 Tax=Gelidibacter sp. TaxID=2018083 RepID=UPI002BA1EAC1